MPVVPGKSRIFMFLLLCSYPLYVPSVVCFLLLPLLSNFLYPGFVLPLDSRFSLFHLQQQQHKKGLCSRRHFKPPKVRAHKCFSDSYVRMILNCQSHRQSNIHEEKWIVNFSMVSVIGLTFCFVFFLLNKTVESDSISNYRQS